MWQRFLPCLLPFLDFISFYKQDDQQQLSDEIREVMRLLPVLKMDGKATKVARRLDISGMEKNASQSVRPISVISEVESAYAATEFTESKL